MPRETVACHDRMTDRQWQLLHSLRGRPPRTRDEPQHPANLHQKLTIQRHRRGVRANHEARLSSRRPKANRRGRDQAVAQLVPPLQHRPSASRPLLPHPARIHYAFNHRGTVRELGGNDNRIALQVTRINDQHRRLGIVTSVILPTGLTGVAEK